MKNIKRGDIIYVDLGQHPKSSVQSGVRPCIVVSNNRNNWFANVLNVLPFSAQLKDNPVHVRINPDDVNGYCEKESDCLTEQIVTIDKRKIIVKVGHIVADSEVIKNINAALCLQLGLSREVD